MHEVTDEICQDAAPAEPPEDAYATSPDAKKPVEPHEETTLHQPGDEGEGQNALQWRAAYRKDPRPLIDPERRIMLIFSPKSACSTTVIWFFSTMGLAKKARVYHEFPHCYRNQQFYRGRDYRRGLAIPPEELKIIRVVRDPVARAASSFRHALGTDYPRQAILAKLGIDIQVQGLSFQQFIDFLEMEDLDNCNAHHRRQVHPVERLRKPDFVINVTKQDLFAGLNAVERGLGMPVTDFPALTWIHDLQRRRVPRSVDVAGDPYSLILSNTQARSGPWPKDLLTREARARLGGLYAEDIALYATVPEVV